MGSAPSAGTPSGLELISSLRGLIDAGRRHGQAHSRFLLLGSASVGLGGFNLLEVQPHQRDDDLWIRGGFPDSLLAMDGRHAASGVRPSFAPIWCATPPSWGSASRRGPCVGSGRCWPTAREACRGGSGADTTMIRPASPYPEVTIVGSKVVRCSRTHHVEPVEAAEAHRPEPHPEARQYQHKQSEDKSTDALITCQCAQRYQKRVG